MVPWRALTKFDDTTALTGLAQHLHEPIRGDSPWRFTNFKSAAFVPLTNSISAPATGALF
jgi:hypothetical protein